MKPELQPPPARKRRSDGQPPSEGNAPLPPWGDGVRCLSPSTVGSKAILLCFWQWITTSISGIPRWNSRCTEKAVVGIFSRKQNLEAEKKEGSIEYKLRYCKMNQYRIWKRGFGNSDAFSHPQAAKSCSNGGIITVRFGNEFSVKCSRIQIIWIHPIPERSNLFNFILFIL